MKIKYPKSLMEPEGLNCRVIHEAYAEQFADEHETKNLISVYVGDECVVDETQYDYKFEARRLRRIAKWLLKVADWLEPQKLYYSDMESK